MVGTNDIKQSLKLYDKILPFAGMKKIESTSDYVGYASIFSDDEKITFLRLGADYAYLITRCFRTLDIRLDRHM